MIKRKICVFTGTRAEYGLLKPLIDELKVLPSIELQLIISGMHLSPEFGLTYREIDTDGIDKLEKVEILLSSDTPTGVSKAMGLGLISYSEMLERLKPDLLIGLGDRFELLAIVCAALIHNIPTVHIHGGEVTSGAFDEAIRHAITKMSHLHFASTENYRKRIIQLGEHPKRVFNVGALGIDNLKRIKLLPKSALEVEIDFKLDRPYFVVTFHPVTLEKNESAKQVAELFKSLQNFPDHKIIFTKSNADNEGRTINSLIDDFVRKNKDRTKAYHSLGQLKYLSVLKYSEMLIGNSSSGIIEMPYLKKPTVNIGNRQKGRICPESVIQCASLSASITKAIKKGLSNNFKSKCMQRNNIFGIGNTSKKIMKILTANNFSMQVKKDFFDL